MSGLFDLLNQDQREHGFKHTQDEILFWLSFCRVSDAHHFAKDVGKFVDLMLHSEQDRKDRIAHL